MISRWMLLSAKEAFMQANNRKNPFLLAPASALAVLVLLLIFGFFEGNGGIKTSILVGVFTVLALGIPLVLYCFLRGARFSAVFPMQKPKKRDMLLALVSLFLLIFMQSTFRYALFGAEFDYREIALYGFTLPFPASIGEWVMMLLAVAVVPAVMEELVFRGAVFYEYRVAGGLFSVLFSAVFVGMMGMSFSAFPWLFLSGAVFALVRFLTGNLLVSMLLHIAYTVYTLTLEKYIWLMSLSDESRTLFFVLSVIFFGISLYCFFHLAEKILRERAKTEKNEPLRVPKNKRILMLFDVLTAPSLWVLLCVYLIVAVVRLFVS